MTIEVVDYTNQNNGIQNFTKDRFISSEYMEHEWESVWRNHWLLAGLTSDVSRPGDYFVFDMGREQILVACNSDGAIKAYYNVCQHRGNQLVASERGHAANFRCAYHAWTYDINGQLSAIPYEERFADGVPCEERALREVHCSHWNGFVFISLAASPMPLIDYLGPIVDRLAPYRFDQMTIIEDQTVHLACNWKAVVDNFSELYHVDFLHPQHKRMVDCCNDTVRLFDHGHTGVEVPGATVNPRFPVPELPTDIQSVQLQSVGLDPAEFKGRVMDVRVALQQQKRKVGAEKGMDYSEFSDDQLSDVWQYNLFPNVILSFTPEHCWVMRVRPHASDPDQCEFDKLSLVKFASNESSEKAIMSAGRHYQHDGASLPDSYQRPVRDVFGYDAVIRKEKTMTDTIDQDVELLAGVQAGMRSKGFDSVFLNDDEIRIQHFHNQLDALIPDA